MTDQMECHGLDRSDGSDAGRSIVEQINDGPKIMFRTTVGGYRAEIDDGRVIELRRGEDDRGRALYALKTENQGHQIDLTFSDEAMDAITRMYCELIVKELADADDEDVPPGSPD